MKSSHIASCLAVAALSGATPAAAQSAQEGDGPAIVVEAPRNLPPPPRAERSEFTGAPVVTTIVRISALYGDLDLTQPANAARLMTRIERVARDACATLDRLYPLNPDPDCVSRAVAQTTPAAQALIAQSKK